MKARIKETGEVFQVDEVCLENGYNYELKDVELIFEGDQAIDWERRRFELVKAVSQAAIQSEFRHELTDFLTKRIITFADAVLAEYMKRVEE